MLINQHTYTVVNTIKMMRQTLILSMVCALSHTLSCPHCWDNPAGPDCKHDPKCCPSGELISDPCGCCHDCAKGTAYTFQDSKVLCLVLLKFTYSEKATKYMNFTGHKMFCAAPNFFRQPKNLTAFSASSKTFVQAQKINFTECKTSSCLA